MNRYLVFSTNNLHSLSLAREICNRNGPWIDEALDMSDPRVVEWLRSTEHRTLTGPAIVRIEQNGVRVVQGEIFRTRVQRMLEPMQAAELMRILQGDSAVPTTVSSNNAGEKGANPGNLRQRAVPKARSTIDRRKFLGLRG